MNDLIPTQFIQNKILIIRGEKVLLDSDLAKLYDVENKYLIRTVKRNIKRFPDDFMYQLSNKEFANLRCQFGTSSWGGRRNPPYAFTEQRIAMLSGILNSERAINVNIAIMRASVQMRKMLKNNIDTNARIDDIEDRLGTQEFQTLALIDQMSSIKKKINSSSKNKAKIGFKH